MHRTSSSFKWYVKFFQKRLIKNSTTAWKKQTGLLNLVCPVRSPEEIESFTLANDPVEFKHVDENGAVVLTEVFPRGPVAFFACHSRQLCLTSELCRIA